MQVVVATRSQRLGVEGDADGAAHKLGEVHRLLDVLGAGNLGQGVLATHVLPLGGVGLGPGKSAVGRDENHEGLRVVGIEIGGGVVAAVGGECRVEVEHGGRSLRQVDFGCDQPFLARGAVNIHLVVVGFNPVAYAVGKLPGVGGVELQGVAVEHVGGSHGAVAGPAGVAVDRGLEALLPRIGHRSAGCAGGDNHLLAVVLAAVNGDTEVVECVGLEVFNSDGGIGSIGHVNTVDSQSVGADALDSGPSEGDTIGRNFGYLQIAHREAGNVGVEHLLIAPAAAAVVVGAGGLCFVVVVGVGLQVGYLDTVCGGGNHDIVFRAGGPYAEGVVHRGSDGAVGHHMQCGIGGADIGSGQYGGNATGGQGLELALGEVAVVGVAAHGADVEVVIEVGIQVGQVYAGLVADGSQYLGVLDDILQAGLGADKGVLPFGLHIAGNPANVCAVGGNVADGDVGQVPTIAGTFIAELHLRQEGGVVGRGHT